MSHIFSDTPSRNEDRTVNRFPRSTLIGLWLFVGVLTVLWPAATAEAAIEIFVSATGNDSDPGSEAKPLQSLEAARDMLRRLKKTGQITNGATVWLAGGIHHRSATFELQQDDSGSEQAPNYYRSVPGAEVRLVGAKKISRDMFKPVTDAAVLARLPDRARDKVLQVGLKAAGVTNLGSPGLEGTLELFCDRKRMQPARWPNKDWALAERAKADSNVEKVFRFTFTGEPPRSWSDLAEVQLHGYWRSDYGDAVVKPERFDREKKEITLTEGLGDGPATGRRFYAFPILEELDLQGEWYLDRTNGLLYLFPPAQFGSEILVSTLQDPLVTVKGASNVVFRGLTFEATRGSAVRIEGGKSNLIAGCTIRHIGVDAVILQGGLQNSVIGCDMHELGSAAVIVAGGDRSTLSPGGLQVLNNHIHHFAQLGRAYRPAVRLDGVGNRVAHNLIHDAPHAAVLYSGNDHLIELNEIHHVVLETSDAGVLYSGYDWSFRGNIVRYNFFHDIPHPPGGYTRVVYLDDAHCSTETFGNVFYRTHQSVWIGGGRDNIVENNIFIDCEEAVSIDNRGLRWTFLNPKGSILETGMYQKLKPLNYDRPPWSTRYPTLANILENDPRAPLGNTFERNVYYRSPYRDPEAWCRSHSDKHIDKPYLKITDNFVADSDPGFIDAGGMDFQLKQDATVFRRVPGFKPIPFGKIGLYRDQYRLHKP
jgi:hypothetical protein